MIEFYKENPFYFLATLSLLWAAFSLYKIWESFRNTEVFWENEFEKIEKEVKNLKDIQKEEIQNLKDIQKEEIQNLKDIQKEEIQYQISLIEKNRKKEFKKLYKQIENIEKELNDLKPKTDDKNTNFDIL